MPNHCAFRAKSSTAAAAYCSGRKAGVTGCNTASGIHTTAGVNANIVIANSDAAATMSLPWQLKLCAVILAAAAAAAAAV
jgi:hypothetical protein